VPAAVARLSGMGRVTLGDSVGWSAPDAEVADLLAAARPAARSPDALAVLTGAEPAGELRLESDAWGRSVAVSLRIAIGLICSRFLNSADPTPEAVAQRDRLYELDQLSRGIEPAAVAPLIGLPLEEAAIAASKLGLRVSTAYMLLNRSERQLDVLAEDGEVTNILGLHID
jgi:hypothetical protein